MYFVEKMIARNPITLMTTRRSELSPSETRRMPHGGGQPPTLYTNTRSNSIRTAITARTPVAMKAM